MASPVTTRRRRCAQCNRLVNFTFEWWPKGYPKRPRLHICEACHRKVRP